MFVTNSAVAPCLHDYLDENTAARKVIRQVIDEGLDWDKMLVGYDERDRGICRFRGEDVKTL